MNKTLFGERIELRALEPTPENVEAVFQVASKNKQHLDRFLSFFTYEDRDCVASHLKSNKVWRENKKGFFFHIFKEGQIIGGLQSTFHATSSDVIYWIDKDNLGKGYAAEALGIFEQLHFSKENISQEGFPRHHLALVLDIRSENIYSIKAAKKAGYLKESSGLYVKTYYRHMQLLQRPSKVSSRKPKLFNTERIVLTR